MLVIWIVALVALIAFGAFIVTGRFDNKLSGGHSESQTAQDLLSARFPRQAGDPADIVFHTASDIRSPTNQAAIAAVVSRVQPLPSVSEVRGPFQPGVFGQVSSNGHTAYAEVQFDATTDNLAAADVTRVVDTARAADGPGFQVELAGQPITKAETASPGSSEAIGILAAIVILLVAFGSVIAMGLPIMTALFGIGMGFGVIDLFSRVVTVPTFGTELAP